MGLIDGDSCECYGTIPPNEPGVVRGCISILIQSFPHHCAISNLSCPQPSLFSRTNRPATSWCARATQPTCLVVAAGTAAPAESLPFTRSPTTPPPRRRSSEMPRMWVHARQRTGKRWKLGQNVHVGHNLIRRLFIFPYCFGCTLLVKCL